MSIDSDIFDMVEYLEDDGTNDKGLMVALFERITDYIKKLEFNNEELGVQAAALKAAIVVKASDINITSPGGVRNYIHLELKHFDKEEMNKLFAAKGGKGNKGNKRPDMQPGGKTYEKRWGKAKKV